MIKPILQLLMGAIAIGMAPIFAKLAITHGGMGAVATGFWRMFVGAIGFLFIIAMSPNQKSSGQSVIRLLKNSKKLVLTAGLMFALDLTSWHTSFNYTSLASSTLIANFSSVLVPLSGVLFFKEVFKRRLAIGGLIAMVGVVGLTLSKQTNGRDSSHDSLLLGEGLAFATAFFYTGYMLSIKKLAGQYSSRTLMFVSSATSAILLFVFSLLMDQQILPTNDSGWIWILGLGLISQVMGQGLIAKALALMPVGQSALLLLFAPVSTAVFSWLFIGEALPEGQFVSVMITLIGIAIVARR